MSCSKKLFPCELYIYPSYMLFWQILQLEKNVTQKTMIYNTYNEFDSVNQFPTSVTLVTTSILKQKEKKNCVKNLEICKIKSLWEIQIRNLFKRNCKKLGQCFSLFISWIPGWSQLFVFVFELFKINYQPVKSMETTWWLTNRKTKSGQKITDLASVKYNPCPNCNGSLS